MRKAGAAAARGGRVLPVVWLAISLALLATAVWVEHRNSRALLQSAAWVEHTHEVIEALSDALAFEVAAHASRRAYALTGDQRRRVAAATHLANADGAIGRVRELTRDNPSQQRRIEEVAALFARRSADVRALLAAPPFGPDAEQREVRATRDGEAELEEIRDAIRAMRDEEEILLHTRRADQEQGSTNLRIATLTITGTSFVLLIGAFALLRGELARRDEAERVATENEQRFRRLLAATPDAIVIVGRDGRIAMVNDRASDVFGYTREELDGMPLEELVPEDARSRHVAHRGGFALHPAVRPMGVAGMSLFGRRKDGTRFPTEISLGPLPEDSGLLAIAAVRDVTAQKEAEAAIERAKVAAESASAELESFSYSVAHDLRTPLRTIDGFSQALLEDYADKLDAEGRDSLSRVRAAASRMGRLIDDLLALSRVSRGDVHREKVDVSTLTRSILGRLHESEPDRDVTIAVAPDLVADADPRLLAVALENLLGNAWKFTSKREHAHIEVGAENARGERIFFVRDDGAGFDMTYANKLFGAFQRLHRSDEFPGTGIGLATVQRVVRRHGGRIWAEAKPGEGATFFFTVG